MFFGPVFAVDYVCKPGSSELYRKKHGTSAKNRTTTVPFEQDAEKE